jgi:hypothetical protein
MSNRAVTVMKVEKREVHTDRCGKNSGQKCHARGIRKETKIQEFM